MFVKLHHYPEKVVMLNWGWHQIGSLKTSALLAVILAIGSNNQRVQAQTQPVQADGSTSTKVNSPNPNQFNIEVIEGGTQAGTNLFHSFSQFNLNQNQIANFVVSNPSIQNILARVTGGNASYINGLIQVTGGNSNLYLMNPAGIVFGANASLNVPASFTATTANAIGFGSNYFNAYASNNYAALVGTPSTFAFTMNQPGAISNLGDLTVNQGQNLTLIGGTVVSTGTLNAPGGNITLAAVPGESVVRLSLPHHLLSLEIQPINLANSPGVASLPASFSPLSLPELLTGGGGNQATQLTVNSAGEVILTGSGLQVKNGDVVDTNKLNTTSRVNGGSVVMSANGNVITSEIDARSESGNGGFIFLNAKENITTTGELLTSSILGNGGTVTFKAGSNITTYQIWTNSRNGNGGEINLTAGGDIITENIFSRSTNWGDSGVVTINAGGNIVTGAIATHAKQGNGGNIFLISHTGSVTNNTLASGSAHGNGGLIKIEAYRNITLNEILSGTLLGQGGDVSLKAGGTITISPEFFGNYLANYCGTSAAVALSCGSNGSSFTFTPTPGTSTFYPGLLGFTFGKVTITGGTTTLTNSDGSNTSANNLTIVTGGVNGNAGNMTVNAGGNFNTDSMDARALQGDGGNINLNANNVTIGDANTSSKSGGTGGDITMSATNVIKGDSWDSRSLDRSRKDGKIDLTASEIYLRQIFSNNFSLNQQSPNQINLNDTLLKIEQQRTKEFERYFGDTSLWHSMTAASIRERLSEVEREINNIKPAIIYVNALPDGEYLEFALLTTGNNEVIYKKTEVKRSEVEKVAREFRTKVSDFNLTHSDSYKQSAQKLYNLLIKPIESDLQKQKITTLLFSLDAGLRALPIAALYDGEKFLVEKYNLALIPSVTLTDTRYKGVKNAQVLAMGRSQFSDRNQKPLPAVTVEIKTIAERLWSGKAFLNEEFTSENLKSQRRQQPFQIIHLATHAEFLPGGNSYIHLGNRQLRLDELRELEWNKPPEVELLVLSACRTALGDEKAEMGFAGLAVQAGVKSALASLWQADDVGTLGLMTGFYHHLKTEPIKAEALRQAQIAMLRGKVEVREGQLYLPGMVEGIPLPPQLTPPENGKLRHPYYWAAFTLIGSPW